MISNFSAGFILYIYIIAIPGHRHKPIAISKSKGPLMEAPKAKGLIWAREASHDAPRYRLLSLARPPFS